MVTLKLIFSWCFINKILILSRRIYIFHNKWNTLPPGRGLEEVTLPVHEFRSKPGHLVFHLSHFRVKPLADVGEFCVDNAEVAQLDGDVPLDTIRHGGAGTEGEVERALDEEQSGLTKLHDGLGMDLNSVSAGRGRSRPTHARHSASRRSRTIGLWWVKTIWQTPKHTICAVHVEQVHERSL